MEAFQEFLTLLIGLVVRLGLPVGVTFLVIWLLNRLDIRWQSEAEHAGIQVTAHNTRCWEVRGCTEELMQKCLAYQQQDKPCWQVFRNPNGQLREGCIDCAVFLNAPVPAGD